MEGELGSLAVGREADVSALDVLKGRFVLSDNSGAEVVTDTLIRPAFCLRGGGAVRGRFAARAAGDRSGGLNAPGPRPQP